MMMGAGWRECVGLWWTTTMLSFCFELCVLSSLASLAGASSRDVLGEVRGHREKDLFLSIIQSILQRIKLLQTFLPFFSIKKQGAK